MNVITYKNNKRYTFPEINETFYLNKREAECMMLKIKGHTIIEISMLMSVTINSIRAYQARIREKLDNKKMSEIVKIIKKTNFIEEFLKEKSISAD
jgi:DNA-binding CsgD family transcriptional regulator